jgi:YbbR domain-containing protein
MNTLIDFFRRNLLLKAVSGIIALFIWIYVTIGQPDAEVSRKVAVMLVNMPANMVRVSDVITHVDISVTGPRNILRNVKNETLSFEIDLNAATAGATNYKVIESRIKGIPPGASVTSVSPTQINVLLAERSERVVPVSITIKGKPAEGYEVAEMVAEPPLVEVSGAADEVTRLKFVPTEAIDVTGERKTIRRTVAIDLSGQHVEAQEHKEVQVSIEIEARLATRKFTQVPIDVEGTTLEAFVKPGALDFPLQGPEVMINGLSDKKLKLVIDASGLEAGTYELKPEIRLPNEGAVVQTDLPLVQVTLKMGKKKSISSGKKKIQ